MNAGTIVGLNYLAYARVLAASYVEHHPDATFSVLVVDAPPHEPPAGERFEVLAPADVGLEEVEYRRMAAIYNRLELATAVKPWLLRRLLERSGGEPVVYLDPDIEVFAPLSEVEVLARKHSIVLTPHIVKTAAYDPDDVPEKAARLGGIFNLGFVAVGEGSEAFLDWWAGRLSRECIVSPDRGLHVDQRWVDFAPGLFEHAILRDPSYNVAWWSLPRLEFEWTGERYEVDGEPLRFFHFTGFDPMRPELFSRHQGDPPRVLLSERPALRKVCAEYASKALAAGYAELYPVPYGWAESANGMPLDRRTRRLYRSALLAAEFGDGEEPPNPFEDGEGFLRWLNEPVEGGGSVKISRYVHALWMERPDLRGAFPDVRWRDAERFRDWVIAHARDEERIPAELIPAGDADTLEDTEPEPLAPGLTLVGYLRAELGTGEIARQLVRALELTGIPFATVSWTATPSRQQNTAPERPDPPRYDTNLVCVNADRLPDFSYEVGPGFFDGRYSIGVWWWEIARFPREFAPAAELVDEIWVGSDHVAGAVAEAAGKPVLTIPVPVEVPPPPERTRAELGLPEGFVFLFSFDFLSVFERKNPVGVVEAFCRAFQPGEGPSLVVKSINGERAVNDLERLRAAAAGRSDIRVVDGYVSPDDKNALMAACDCYVSLHRSEGFGLTLAEAMAFGRPVIATAYSGNLTFMDEANSYLVPYETGRVPRGCAPYPEGAEWAEPDLDEAARLLRHVYEHPEEARERAERGRATIRDNHSPERTAGFIVARMDEIRAMRDAQPEPEATRDRGLDRAFDFVTQRADFANGDGRGPGGLARRALYRVLRPYTFRQEQFESAVVDGLREADEANSCTNDELARLGDAVERLARDVADLRHTYADRLDRIEAAVRSRGSGD